MPIFRDLEQCLVTIALVIVVIAAIVDYLEDWSHGATLVDLLFDTALNLFVAGTLLYIVKQRHIQPVHATAIWSKLSAILMKTSNAGSPGPEIYSRV